VKTTDILRTLVAIPAVSGFERDISQTLLSFFPNASIDDAGNVILKICSGKKKILVEAHMDEVGFIKTSKGYVKVGEIEAFNIQDIVDLDRFSFFKRRFECKDNIVKSPALDNKVGCTALILFAKVVKSINADLFIAFTTQEETTGRGIKTVIQSLKPDFIISLDAAYAQPYACDRWQIPILGAGPAIQIQGEGFFTSHSVLEAVKKLEVQYEIVDSNEGATNLSYISNITEVAQINIPVRSQHSAESEVSIQDIEDTIPLLIMIIQNYLNTKIEVRQ